MSGVLTMTSKHKKCDRDERDHERLGIRLVDLLPAVLPPCRSFCNLSCSRTILTLRAANVVACRTQDSFPILRLEPGQKFELRSYRRMAVLRAFLLGDFAELVVTQREYGASSHYHHFRRSCTSSCGREQRLQSPVGLGEAHDEFGSPPKFVWTSVARNRRRT